MGKESSSHQQGVPSFEYNPADERFPVLFELRRPLDELAPMLLDAYSNKTLSCESIYEQHSVGKPYTQSNYKEVLRTLAESGKVKTQRPGGKPIRNGTFPDDVLVTFPPKGEK